MDKKDYINTLKDLNLRPNKVKIKEREEKVLLEQDSGTGDIHNKIIKWFMENPNPDDSKVHKFAETLNMGPDDLEGHIYMILSEILSGGRSKGKNNNYNPKEIAMGIEVEKEHTSNPLIAEKIAWDHLDEISDYYTRLKKMEKEAGVKESKLLKEIFIKMGEVQNMPQGTRRHMAILRLAIIAEYDAASLYEKMADLVTDDNIRKVLLDVANEEKQHIGEFEFLLEHIDPEHEKNENEGEEEVKKMTSLDVPPNELE